VADGSNLAFRVDAGTDCGIGHFRRCLVLAEALQKAGCLVSFFMSSVPNNLKGHAESKGVRVFEFEEKVVRGSEKDSDLFVGYLKSEVYDWIVYDGYEFKKNYRKSASSTVRHTLIIQDVPGDYSDADIVLNQNVNVDLRDYRLGANGKLLNGTTYSLIAGRCDLREKRISTDKQKPNILITLGGADVGNLTLSVVESLMELDVDINAVLGPACSWDQSDFDRFEDKLNVYVSPNGLDQLIAGADIGVMSMGITTWEMCFYGLPFVMLGCNLNQQPVIDWFVERELAVSGLCKGEFVPDYFVQSIKEYLHNHARRRAHSENLMKLVDGSGPDRVVKEISNIV
jgi:UDP-2,4-diacetamido-2,4,6-trideoxy-beta-L-altropyranose hydrolase